MAYSAPDIGVVGCRLVRPDGMLQHVGTYLPLDSFAGEQIGACERDIDQFPGNNEVEGVVFACVYLKRETLNTVGLLDEDYFSYFEDTDYCFRVKGARATSSVLRLRESDSSRARVYSREWIPQSKVFQSAQHVLAQWESKLRSKRYTR